VQRRRLLDEKRVVAASVEHVVKDFVLEVVGVGVLALARRLAGAMRGDEVLMLLGRHPARGQPVWRDLGYDRAAPGPHEQNADGRELNQRFPDRRARHAEALGQIRLVESSARQQRAGGNELLDLLPQLFGSRQPLSWRFGQRIKRVEREITLRHVVY